MKVCHVTSAHNRYDGRIFQKECCSLTKKYDVYLLVNDKNNDELKNNVHIISTKFKPKNRFERFFKSKNSIIKKALEIDADIYHLHDPDLLNMVEDLKEQNKKIVFDSHEDYPQLIKEKEWIPRILRSLASKYYENKEKKILKKVDAVVSVTPHIVNRLKKINDNTYMITNYPILSNKNIIKHDDGHTICFAGGISTQWLHHNVIKAIDGVDNVRYLLIGDNENSYFETLKKLEGFNKVEVIGKVSKEEVLKFYNQSTLGIALNDYVANVNFKKGTIGNTKIFEYMEAGLPIVATDFELWKDIIEKNDCGICVDPNDIEQIRRAILYIIEHPKRAKEMGINGKNLVLEQYNWLTQEKILYDMYSNLIERL